MEDNKETKKKWECNLCKYNWVSIKDEKPKACPRCKRYDWEKYR